MQPEIEVKFLNVNHDDVRAKLKAAGATCTRPLAAMRRTVFDFSDGRLRANNFGRLRVRDEGDKITMTFKDGNDQSYSNEVEITVDSYEHACALVQAIGLQPLSMQETKRETWAYDGVEIMLDEWPWVPPFIEIEGKNEADIQRVAAALGFDWSTAFYGSSDSVYRHHYPKMTDAETIGKIPELKFSGERPGWLADRQ